MLLRVLTRTGRWLFYLLAGLLLLLALLVTMARFAVLHDGDYSERLASLVSRYVGSPVQIDEVDLVWDRFLAVASLKDVKILSADGEQTDLTLPSIQLELNLKDMLLRRNLSIRKVQLKDLSLVAEYKGHGELEILGREIRRRNTGDAGSMGIEGAANSGTDERGRNALAWLFNADRIAILDSSITLTDHTRNTTHNIDNVDIRAFNDDELHQIRISSSLPDAFGKTSVAAFDFTGNAADIRDWNGQFYINTSQLNLGEISGLFEGKTIDGIADLQVWGRWSGTRVNEFRVIGSIHDYIMQPLQQDQLLPFSVDKVDVDIDWIRGVDGWQANFNQLVLAFGSTIDDLVNLNGLVFTESRENGGLRQYRLAGPAVDLRASKPLIDSLVQHLTNDNIRPVFKQGTVENWQLIAELNENQPLLKTFSADLTDLQFEMSALSVQQLSASVVFDERVGRVEIASDSVISGTGAWFSDDMPAVNLSGTIHFADTSQRRLFASDDLQVRNNDIVARTSFNLRFNQFQQRLLDSVTEIEYINLSNAKRYLPAKGIKPKLRSWLSTAIIGGDIVRGQVTVSGDLTDFAPGSGKGTLFGELDIVDSNIKFKPDWPVARQMDGNLTFNASSLRGRVYRGAIREAKFSDARLFIADFKQPKLELQTNAIGPLDDMLDFAQRGPLASRIGGFFGDATGAGASRMELDLTVPLKRELRDQLRVNGSVLLENAQISAQKFGLNLESVTGNIAFNRQGVLIDDLLVRYLGIPVKVNASQKLVGNKSVNSVEVNGPFSIASVLDSYNIPMTRAFEGISNWQVKLDITRTRPGTPAQVELTAKSDQTGTAVNLPVPFKKPSDTIREVRITRNFSSKEKDWWVELPGLAQLRIRIGADRELESMAIALGRSNNTVLPWRGVAVHGDVGRVDALGWFQFSQQLRELKKSRIQSEPFPLYAKVTARSVLVGEQHVGNGVYIAFKDGDTQVHRIESPLIGGEIKVKPGGGENAPVVLRLDKLDKQLLTAFSDANSVTGNMTSRPFHPRQLPPLDIVVKELKWDNWRISRVALRTIPADSGLQITSLTGRQESLRVSGSGAWLVSPQGLHTTNLDITSSVDNLGKSMLALGGGKSFADGAGESALSLTWPGPAYRPDLKKMTGTLYISLRDGRVLGVEPGAGRILGLFALQALPRRLALDFRDIVKTGLEFTTINGNFTIADGKLSSQTLLFTGPAAEILIHGYSDFSEQYYNQTVDVLPRVSGALPLIGVLSGGPAAGVTALVADGILKGLGVNLDEIGRRRFILTGSWENPTLESVDLQAAK